ncbi:MAG: hypothetical protein ACOC6N_03910 [archaeon]
MEKREFIRIIAPETIVELLTDQIQSLQPKEHIDSSNLAKTSRYKAIYTASK